MLADRVYGLVPLHVAWSRAGLARFAAEDSGPAARWAQSIGLLTPPASKDLLPRSLPRSSKDAFEARLHLTFNLRPAALGLLMPFLNLRQISYWGHWQTFHLSSSWNVRSWQWWPRQGGGGAGR